MTQMFQMTTHIFVILIQFILIRIGIMKEFETSSSKIENGKSQGEGKKKITKAKSLALSKRSLRKALYKKIERIRINSISKRKNSTLRNLSACINRQQYNCSICLQLIIYPTTLQCGHTFCLPCVQSFNKAVIKNQCSLCRADNSIRFHEIDLNVQKIIQYIQEHKLSKVELEEYQCRKKSFAKQFEQRGIKDRLKLNDQIKIKVKNFWVKGKIINVFQNGEKIYYEVYTVVSEEVHLIRKKSINIKQEQIEKADKTKRQSNCIFSEEVFIEENRPRRQDNTYNIQQILWEVPYYEPPSEHIPIWFIPNTEYTQRDQSGQNMESDYL